VKFKLPGIINKWGFNHKLIQSKGLIAIYEKTKRKFKGWEVMIFKEHPPYELGGMTFPAGINPPGNEQWGLRGWTYTTLADAEKKYKSLIK
jgi:hypothetical protein